MMEGNNCRSLMKSRLLFIISIGFVSIFARPAGAYDANSTVNFNVTGKIEEPVCEVSIKPSSTIDLGTVSYQSLSGKPGASSAAKIVAIAFDNCSLGTASVTITFSGTSFSSTYTDIYESENIYGAKDVGLQLLSAGIKRSWGQMTAIPMLSLRVLEHVFNMNARMYTPNGRARGKCRLYGHF